MVIRPHVAAPSKSLRARLCAAGAIVLAAGALIGCEDPSARIARMEKELASAKAESDRLGLQLAQRDRQLAAQNEQLAAINQMPPDRWERVPKAERLEIGRYSGLRTGKPQLSGSPATQPAAVQPVNQYVRLFVHAVDSAGMRVRVAGPMKITLVDLAVEPPAVLGAYPFDPAEAARHYVSALSTELFAFDLPLSAAPRGGVTVRVELTDALTGKTLVAQKLLDQPAP